MRKLIMIAIAATALSTQLFSQTTNEFFEIISATSQVWAGGPAGSGSGVNYVFNLVIKKDTRLGFDTVWVSAGDTISSPINELTDKDAVYKKGATLTLYAAHNIPGQVDTYDGYKYLKETSKPPMVFTGIALLRFFVNGTAYYYGVENMQQLPPIAYP